MSVSIVPSADGLSGAIQVGGVNALTFDRGGVLSGASYQAPFRNRLINSDMSVNQIYNPTQAANGTAVTPATPPAVAGVIDQWQHFSTQASKLTYQQVSDAPAGLKYSTKISVASQYSPLATDRFQFYQNVEGQNIIDFQLGTAGAVTIITSYWIKGSVAGDYSVSISDSIGSRSYVGIIRVTTAWQRLSVSFVGDTAGTWATDNTTGFTLRFDLGCGSNFNTTAGSWQTGNLLRTSGSIVFVNQVVGSTLNITGAQVETVSAGATQPTMYEFLPYETQLRRAQRYLPCLNYTSVSSADFFGIGFFFTTSTAIFHINFPTETRVPPTSVAGASITTPGQINLIQTVATISTACTAVAIQQTSTRQGRLIFTGTGAPYTAGQPAEVYLNTAAGQMYWLGAQL